MEVAIADMTQTSPPGSLLQEVAVRGPVKWHDNTKAFGSLGYRGSIADLIVHYECRHGHRFVRRLSTSKQ